ncbi:hypothetical protein SAMN04488688_10760 [Paenibacillus sp. cl141a]|nr:hypothetical protein SAMN04488688_10760 [Paenibacillus sp. cl141a]
MKEEPYWISPETKKKSLQTKKSVNCPKLQLVSLMKLEKQLDIYLIGNRNMFLSFLVFSTSSCPRLGTRTCNVKTKKSR